MKHLVYPIIVGIIVYFFTSWQSNRQKPKLEVLYALTDTKPYREDAQGKLTVKYETDQDINKLEIEVRSIGKSEVKDIDIDIRSMKPNLFSTPTVIFEPQIIEERVESKNTVSERIYYKLSDLPVNACLSFYIDGKTYFRNDDIKIGVIGNGICWKPIQKKIDLKYNESFLKRIFGYLKFPINNTFAEEVNNKTISESTKEKPKGGIYFGGYDPSVLTNEIFLLLQTKKIINNEEAQKIKKISEGFRSGISIGGVDVLKFDEEIINLMIYKKIINKEQAERILERSQKAGGILINGYNIIQIKIELLNALLEKKLISLSEAQNALDNSKAK